jgi:UDP-N-acetylmuramyl pentapeptide phosphotransferase/UDP-N-acetylglucosamine-1-phosphate transferase
LRPCLKLNGHGIDGITGAQTIHISLGFLIITAFLPYFPDTHNTLAACLTGASLGFLFWNWHPAKLFMGDVGSIPLGFLLGYLMMMLAIHGYLGVALVLPLYYVADASITLIRRIMEKKKFWLPHREHFYQRATLALGNPAKVTRLIIMANVGLLIIAIASITLTSWLLIFAPLLVAWLLWYLQRLSIQKA